MKSIFAGIILLSSVFLTGCITTDVKSFKDPKFTPVNAKTVFLESTGAFKFNDEFYKQMSKLLEENGYKVTTLYDLFPPVRQHDRTEIIQKVKDVGFDMIFVFDQSYGGVHVSQWNGPTTTQATMIGNTMYATSSTQRFSAISEASTYIVQGFVPHNDAFEAFYKLEGSMQAGGLAFVGNIELQAEYIAESIVNDLKDNKILSR